MYICTGNLIVRMRVLISKIRDSGLLCYVGAGSEYKFSEQFARSIIKICLNFFLIITLLKLPFLQEWLANIAM